MGLMQQLEFVEPAPTNEHRLNKEQVYSSVMTDIWRP